MCCSKTEIEQLCPGHFDYVLEKFTFLDSVDREVLIDRRYSHVAWQL
jgi:hypothetical protein